MRDPPRPGAVELRQLRYFAAVAEELHFARSPRSVALTPAGVALLDHARRVLGAADDLRDRAAGLAERRLRVAHLADADTLSLVLDRLEGDAPDVAVADSVTASPGEQVRALRAGHLDAATSTRSCARSTPSRRARGRTWSGSRPRPCWPAGRTPARSR